MGTWDLGTCVPALHVKPCYTALPLVCALFFLLFLLLFPLVWTHTKVRQTTRFLGATYFDPIAVRRQLKTAS